jgi:Zn-dependent peptidase ImmA (M78 family)
MYRANPQGQITIAQLCTLADLYQVSVQALVIRLEKLKRIPTGTWDRLEGEGFKPRRAQQLLGIDPNPTEQYELPRRFLNLAVMAYEQELISEGQLTRLLRSDRVSSRELVTELSHRYFVEPNGYEDVELDLAQVVTGR